METCNPLQEETEEGDGDEEEGKGGAGVEEEWIGGMEMVGVMWVGGWGGGGEWRKGILLVSNSS